MLRKIQKLLPYFSNLGFVDASSFLIGRLTKGNEVIQLANIRNPIYLRPGTSDQGVFGQIFVQREYDIKLGFEPKVIIDGGANIGLFSVFIKNRYPDAKIIAIEPDEENFQMLCKNTAAYEHIYPKKAGLWSRKMQARTVDKFGVGKWGLVTEEVQGSGNGDFVTYTIQDIMDEFGLEYIDLLKLDIETAEKQLFAENFSSWLPKVKVIIIELHDWMEPGCSKPFFAAINQTFNDYSFGQVGENTVIVNRDLVKK